MNVDLIHGEMLFMNDIILKINYNPLCAFFFALSLHHNFNY